MGFTGGRRINLKADQPESIMALNGSIARGLTGEIINEESPVDEPHRNGIMERANRQAQGMVRACSAALESSHGARALGTNHDIPWIVNHATTTISWFRLGNDGTSALQRLHGNDAGMISAR